MLLSYEKTSEDYSIHINLVIQKYFLLDIYISTLYIVTYIYRLIILLNSQIDYYCYIYEIIVLYSIKYEI